MKKKFIITAGLLGCILLSPALQAAPALALTDPGVSTDADDPEVDVTATLVNIIPVSEKEGYLDFRTDDGITYRSDDAVDLTGLKVGATFSAKSKPRKYINVINYDWVLGGWMMVITCRPID